MKFQFNRISINGFWILPWIKRTMFRSCDPSSLAFNRILFGSILLLDIVYERGLSRADRIWFDDTDDLITTTNHQNGSSDRSNPKSGNLPGGLCRFPLFPSITKLPLEAMYAVYTGMVCGIVGIIVGYRYRTCCALYSSLYWYLLIIEKSRWNNHSYLFGLLSLMNLVNDSHCKWSIDSLKRFRKLGPGRRVQRFNASTVPFWQYFIVRFQIFLLYFYAGVKKIDWDWLGGYSMVNLSKNWVFTPFRPLVSDYFIDYYLIHLGGFLFDISVGFLFLCHRTRPLAFVLCSIFNLTNSQLFSIGMFPWSMLAIMPIFCSPDWPLKFGDRVWKWIQTFFKRCSAPSLSSKVRNSNKKSKINNCDNNHQEDSTIISLKQLLVIIVIGIYMVVQLLLPFSYIWLPGYNTWSNGMYGYGWDMMIHNWNHFHSKIVVKAMVQRDCDSQQIKGNQTIDSSKHHSANSRPELVTFYLNPHEWTQTNRWYHHSDMVLQFSQCIHHRLSSQPLKSQLNIDRIVSIHLDTWISLNGRFGQRMYNPKQNLLEAKWSPFQRSSWIMPIISDDRRWRRLHYDRYEDIVDGQSEYIREFYRNISRKMMNFPMFIADFPGMQLDNYIDPDYQSEDSWLILIDGTLRVTLNPGNRQFILYHQNDTMRLPVGNFVEILVISSKPAFYALLNPMKNQSDIGTNSNFDSDQMGNGDKCFGKNQKTMKENRWISSFRFFLLGLRYIGVELIYRNLILRLGSVILGQLFWQPLNNIFHQHFDRCLN